MVSLRDSTYLVVTLLAPARYRADSAYLRFSRSSAFFIIKYFTPE